MDWMGMNGYDDRLEVRVDPASSQHTNVLNETAAARSSKLDDELRRFGASCFSRFVGPSQIIFQLKAPLSKTCFHMSENRRAHLETNRHVRRIQPNCDCDYGLWWFEGHCDCDWSKNLREFSVNSRSEGHNLMVGQLLTVIVVVNPTINLPWLGMFEKPKKKMGPVDPNDPKWNGKIIEKLKQQPVNIDCIPSFIPCIPIKSLSYHCSRPFTKKKTETKKSAQKGFPKQWWDPCDSMIHPGEVRLWNPITKNGRSSSHVWHRLSFCLARQNGPTLPFAHHRGGGSQLFVSFQASRHPASWW